MTSRQQSGKTETCFIFFGLPDSHAATPYKSPLPGLDDSVVCEDKAVAAALVLARITGARGLNRPRQSCAAYLFG